MPLEFSEIALAWLLMTLGSMVQAAFGFGLALIAAAPMALVDPALIPGPLLAASMSLTFLMTLRHHQQIHLSGLGYSIFGRMLGTLTAALFMNHASQSHFDLMFGGSVVLAVLLSAAGITVTANPFWATNAGALSGMMATISSIGGPPMALLYQDTGAERLRGTLAAFFSVGTILSLVALLAIGRFGEKEIILSLLITPPAILGFVLAAPLRRNLSDQWIRPAVLLLSLASALAVIWRAIRS